MRKNEQSEGLKTSEPINRAVKIDDWYEDWKPIGRGIIWSYEQNTLRCAYCRKDLLIYNQEAVISKFPTYDLWPGEKPRFSLWLPVAVRSAQSRSQRKCLCQREECETIWSMSVGLE